MNIKNTLVSTVVASIVYFILGGLFYQVIFPDLYPAQAEVKMSFILFGCIVYSLMVSLVLVNWTGAKTLASGLQQGAILGFLTSLSMNFFMYSGMEVMAQNFITDVGVTTVMSACIGALIGVINGKMS